MIAYIIMIFIFVFVLISISIYIPVSNTNNKEKFMSCDKIPSGPYKNKCTNIHYTNNTLYALCPKHEPENIFEISKLDLADCVNDTNDCDSINVDWDGNLICE